jgi:hypothetical protein
MPFQDKDPRKTRNANVSAILRRGWSRSMIVKNFQSGFHNNSFGIEPIVFRHRFLEDCT